MRSGILKKVIFEHIVLSIFSLLRVLLNMAVVFDVPLVAVAAPLTSALSTRDVVVSFRYLVSHIRIFGIKYPKENGCTNADTHACLHGACWRISLSLHYVYGSVIVVVDDDVGVVPLSLVFVLSSTSILKSFLLSIVSLSFV
jgi:hypothetical protein